MDSVSAREALDALARFCSWLRFKDLPEALVAKAKVHVLDTLGAALAGTRSAEFATVLATLAPVAAGAQVWGTDRLATPRDAALANGVAAHAFELDDCGGCDHSGAVVVPALLAALPLAGRPVSGRDFLAAVVVGYEAGRRVLEASGGYEAHNGAGWHSTGTCGTIAAAAAVARLLGLDPARLRDAATLATSFSSGLWAFIHDGSQAKKIHAGRAAEGGLLAAQLAAAGLRGPSKVFDDVWGGFFRSFDRTPGDASRLAADLGRVWKLDRVSLKPYASCRGAHSSVDAVSDILAETRHAADQIETIEVRLSEMLMGMCGSKETARLARAQMSLPYAVAAFCTFGEAGLSAYGETARNDPRIADMLARIRLHPDPAMDASGEPLVGVVFRDGTKVERTVPRATGSPERPMTSEAVDAKFRSLAEISLGGIGAKRLRDAVLHLETVDDVATIATALAGAGFTGETLR